MKRPLRIALHEARLVIVICPLVAIAYNIFAATAIPWVRELRQGDTVSYDELVGTGTAPIATFDTSSITLHDTATAVDTAAGTKVATDTLHTAMLATQPHSEQELEHIRDSIRQVHVESIRIRDSLKAAEAATNPSKPPVADTPKELPKEIGTATAKRVFDGKQALFIDARPADLFSQGHIPGAINVYAEDFNPHIPMLLGYPRDTLVVAYCGGGLCELSHDLADKLRTLGFKRVVVYTGGTAEWNEKNYPFTGK